MPDRTAPTRHSNLKDKLKQCWPPLHHMWLGSLLWGCAMLASLGMDIWLKDREMIGKSSQLAVLFFLGGALAWPFCLYLARFWGMGRGRIVRFFIAILCLKLGTVAMTAFLFSQQYRLFYAQWHAPFMTKIWIIQFLTTSASAVYQFGLFGLAFYYPTAVLCLFAASLWLARSMR